MVLNPSILINKLILYVILDYYGNNLFLLLIDTINTKTKIKYESKKNDNKLLIYISIYKSNRIILKIWSIISMLELGF